MSSLAPFRKGIAAETKDKEAPLGSVLDVRCVNAIRILAIDMVEAAGSGHPGMPMGAAGMAYVLWTRYLRHNPANPDWPGRDRFVLSAGHGSALLYALLYLSGYALELEDLKRFRRLGSRTPGHPERGLTPGVETTTGPLGQGFANGVGMAMAAKHIKARFARDGYEDLFEQRIFGLVSDGDLMEGVTAEAASLAGHLGLGNLIYLYDDNRVTIDGPTDLCFSEDVDQRFLAYGWHVEVVQDGNDLKAIDAAIARACEQQTRPTLIRVRTHIAYGSPKFQDTAAAHGKPLGKDEVKRVKEIFGWPDDKDFYVPEEVRAHFGRCKERGKLMELHWRERFNRYAQDYPELARRYEAALARELPREWDKDLPQYAAGESLATREVTGRVLQVVGNRVDNLFGGSADLTESTFVEIKDWGKFSRYNFAGRNVHFGVREHAMAAALNGIAQFGGLIPFGSSFLVFSDYCRPAIRLAAMMKLPVIYVFTHDSIGVGEDGPTHQPVEHLASLRAIPGLVVIRPADANETVEAWRVALEYRKGPVALVLSRQKVTTLDRRNLAPASRLVYGGYVLYESAGQDDIVLIASGSEVELALKATQLLEQRGVRVRVVSMPSFELFLAQSPEYQQSVLPPQLRARLAIEAASPQSWYRLVGEQGDVIGMTSFGASAPAADLMRHFNFTPEHVAERALALLEKLS